MSELLTKITNALNKARKAAGAFAPSPCEMTTIEAKQRLSILTVAKGECESLKFKKGRTKDVSDEEIVVVLKKLIESNQEIIRTPIPVAAAMGALARNALLQRECDILSEFLPQMATQQEIRAVLDETQIREAKNEGAAKGIAIKAVKAAGLMAESKDVIEIVLQIRGQQ